MEECPICYEKYNKQNHKCIKCFHCEKKSCSSCIQRFLIECSNTEPKCLHCNIKWDRRFMIQHLPKKFCNIEYRHHRRNMLYERNKSYLPKISQIVEEKQELKKMDDEISILKKQLDILKENRIQQHTNILQLEENFIYGRELTSIKKKEEIGRPCITEGCLGFLGKDGHCPICLYQTCLCCNIKKEENHVCKEEDTEQWEFIKKSTKPCPKCHVRIYKISGCDQMWCTNCQTPFSWNKGTIEKGTIHNPHYYDWIFNGNHRTLHPRECQENQLPNLAYVSRLREDKKLNSKEIRYILNIHRHLQHISEVEIPRLLGYENIIYNGNDNQNEGNLYRRRILPYLYKIIYGEEESSKKVVEKMDYRISCDIEFSYILTTYIQEQIYIFHSICFEKDYSYENFYNSIKKNQTFFLDSIHRFEKEYNKQYNKLSGQIEYCY